MDPRIRNETPEPGQARTHEGHGVPMEGVEVPEGETATIEQYEPVGEPYVSERGIPTQRVQETSHE